jgi:hypothetical protein
LLANYTAVDTLWPSEHIPSRLANLSPPLAAIRSAHE